MKNFLDKYVELDPPVKGIRGMVMNRAVVPANGLGDIGIELEIEGRALPTAGMLAGLQGPKTRAYWTTHNDGSLRGEALEYVLSTPCAPEELKTLLSGLWEKFKNNGTRFDLSNRCSTHVHVNISGLKINELTSIISLWTAFEDVVVNWCGSDRKANHFCLTASDSLVNISAWEKNLSGDGLRLGDGWKYTALNLRTINNIGSMEFRAMRADENYEPILDFARFVYGLKDFAVKNFKNPERIAGQISEMGPEALFVNICQYSGVSKTFITEVLSHPENREFDRTVMEGFRRAQVLTLGFPWSDWMGEIEKEYVPSPFGEKKAKRTRSALDELAPPQPVVADPLVEEANLLERERRRIQERQQARRLERDRAREEEARERLDRIRRAAEERARVFVEEVRVDNPAPPQPAPRARVEHNADFWARVDAEMRAQDMEVDF